MMTIIKARKYGVAAFKAGSPRYPMTDRTFWSQISDESALKVVNPVSLNDLLGAWLYGWDIANLAEGQTGDWPSVKTLKAIQEASDEYAV